MQSDDFKDSFTDGPRIEGKQSFVIYNRINITNNLDSYGEAEYSNNTDYVSLTNQADYNAGIYRQCVGFVKAISLLGYTGYWEPNGIINSNNVSYGDIIATFDSNENYDGHVAVILSIDNDGAWVMDQNWIENDTTNGGYIRIHYIDDSNYSLVSY